MSDTVSREDPKRVVGYDPATGETSAGGAVTSPLDANDNVAVTIFDASGQQLEYVSPLALFSAKGQNALVADTAEQILAANSSRIGLLICNTHATIAVYIGDSNAVTVNNGFPLAPAGLTTTAPATSQLRLTDYNGPIWAIATGGTPNLAFLEW
jgi:hypothetical protein